MAGVGLDTHLLFWNNNMCKKQVLKPIYE